MDVVITVIIAASIPSSVTGFGFWLLQKKISKRDREQEHKDEIRKKNEILIIKGVNAAIALGEATATALKNGHTNGETDAALAYAAQVKHDQKDFLTEQGIENIFN